MLKKLFMLKKFWFDIQNLYSKKPIYQISKRLSEPVLEYPFIFDEKEIRSGKKQRLIAKFDENGIPLNNPYIDVTNGKLHYYPITIGQVGISVFQSYLKTDSDEDKNRFLKFADWFMQNKSESGDLVYWLTDIPKPEYKVNAPWKSAFAQSRAISILIRAYDITKSNVYLETIEKALNLFYISYDNEGVSVKTEHGFFFEEYPSSEPTMVLDGHLFTLFGFIELMKVKSSLPESLNKKSDELFKLGIQGLIDKLPEFDMGFWLRFNLCKMEHYPETDPCTINYMKIILEQLTVLNELRPHTLLKTCIKKIDSYLNLANYFKSLRLKLTALKELKRL